MKIYTVIAESYESAIKKARDLYGDGVRVQSRRDYTSKSGVFSRERPKCELICYVANAPEGRSESDLNEFEKEAHTPDPSTLSGREIRNTESFRSIEEKVKAAEGILDENLVSDPLRSFLLRKVASGADLPTEIIKAAELNHERLVHPKHFVVFLGPTGSGKTTTLAKVASIYSSKGLSVAAVTLDTYRMGAFEQIKAFADELGIRVEKAGAEDELFSAIESFVWKDVVLIDTMGVSPNDKELKIKLKSMLSILEKDRTDFMLVIPANMKENDAFDQYRNYNEFPPTSIAVTKLDETETMGNVLSFSYRIKAPIMFLADGQRVPKDIKKASAASVFEHLKGMGLDMKHYSTQFTTD